MGVIGAFEFDADAEIVALLATTPRRHPCMPGTLIGRHKLNHLACALDEEVCRYLEVGDFGKIRMAARI